MSLFARTLFDFMFMSFFMFYFMLHARVFCMLFVFTVPMYIVPRVALAQFSGAFGVRPH